MKHSRIHIVAYGAVQGVGFRAWARGAARRLELCGRVWNRGDGAVEMEAAGPADALRRWQDLVHAGPPGGRVDRVEELPPGWEALPCPFDITY
ncbi:MAG: acylphosphatase [Gemmatimonadota bacterium]